jgi:hypothetical protein
MDDSSPDRDDGTGDDSRGEETGFGDGAGHAGEADDGFGEEGTEDDSQSGDGDVDDAWRFGLDDVDEDGIVQSTIEPGTPSLENALFVVLGVLGMVSLIAWLWALL